MSASKRVCLRPPSAMNAFSQMKWPLRRPAQGVSQTLGLGKAVVDGTIAKDDDRAADATHRNDNKTCFATLPHQGGSYVEVENRGGSRGFLRGGPNDLGLCPSQAGGHVLRVARFHDAAWKARRPR